MFVSVCLSLSVSHQHKHTHTLSHHWPRRGTERKSGKHSAHIRLAVCMSVSPLRDLRGDLQIRAPVSDRRDTSHAAATAAVTAVWLLRAEPRV